MSKRTEAAVLNEFQDLECQLSPENLHCDGEITRAQAESKRKKIMRRWKELVAELGREPSDTELYPRI